MPEVEVGSIRAMSIAEAIAVFDNRKAESIKMENFRVVMLHAEMIPFAQSHGPQVFTKQHVGLMDGHKMVVRTELHQIVPIKNGPDSVPAISVSLKYATQSTYLFEPDTTEEFMVVSTRIMGVMHNWPFWRSFVYSALAEMGGALAITPLLNPELAAEMAGFTKPDTTPNVGAPT